MHPLAVHTVPISQVILLTNGPHLNYVNQESRVHVLVVKHYAVCLYMRDMPCATYVALSAL